MLELNSHDTPFHDECDFQGFCRDQSLLGTKLCVNTKRNARRMIRANHDDGCAGGRGNVNSTYSLLEESPGPALPMSCNSCHLMRP